MNQQVRTFEKNIWNEDLDNNDISYIKSIIKTDKDFLSDLMYHASNCEKIIKILIDDGDIDINIINASTNILMDYFNRNHKTTIQKELNFAKYLIEKGINLNQKDKFGNTILMNTILSMNQYLPILKLFVENGADINACISDTKESILILYIKQNGKDIRRNRKIFNTNNIINTDNIMYLLEKGADIDVKDHKSHTELYYAKKYRMVEVIDKIYLIKLEKQRKKLKEYYQKELEQKLLEQKTQIYDELYKPDGLGYKVAKNRFEKN